jgi:NitT/TauT family transport system substrate-binding protein
LRTFADVGNKSVATSALGSASHYQLDQIARIKQIDVDRVSVRPMPTLDAIARAVGTNQIDAAIPPASYAREFVAANHAKLVVWYSTSSSWAHCLSPPK